MKIRTRSSHKQVLKKATKFPKNGTVPREKTYIEELITGGN